MMRRASILGGSWLNDDNAGSRYANVDNWPDNSNENIGVRGRSDGQFSARLLSCGSGQAIPRGFARPTAGGSRRSVAGRSRSCRPATAGLRSRTITVGGQPGCPALAKTLRGSAERGVAGHNLGGRSGSRRPLTPVARRNPRPASFDFRTTVFDEHPFFDEHPLATHYRNLIGHITADSTMRDALRLTSRGKRLTTGFLEFKEYSQLNLDELATEMRRGEYVAGPAHEFQIFDPKLRTISAMPFRDRVAQQALCLVIAPIFDRLLLPHTYACRPGKGTHAGVREVQATLRRLDRRSETVYVLKTDFSRYFASIELPVLWQLIEKKISCTGTLRLIEAMVPREGIGLPIGSLTSQIFANVYTGMTLDRFLQQQHGERDWFRYMDDLVVLGTSSDHLRDLKREIERFSAERLGLRFSKWSIAPASRGINFLGYRIWSTHKLLRRDSVVRARRKIAAYRAAGARAVGDFARAECALRLERFLAAWLGHASHGDTRNLVTALGIGERA